MNLPNKLTILRIILIPVFAVFFLIDAIPFNFGIAAIIFCAAAFTDFLDGYLARKLNLVTNLGKFLDPIADKILVSTALILLLTVNQPLLNISAICVAVILARELMISAFRQIAAANNVIMAADWAGKVKTFVQDIAIVVLIVACQISATAAYKYIFYIGFALLVIATLLTIYSAVNYIVKNRQVLRG